MNAGPRGRLMDALALPPREVDPAGIDKELAKLPRLGGGTSAEGQEVFRACTLNLVVIVRGRAEAQRASRLAVLMSGLHPSRTVMVILQPRARASSLTSRVGGQCRLTESGQRQICCELIELTARGHITEHLHSAMASLLAGDLPVFVWWPGGLPPPPSEKMAEGADVVITGGGRETDPFRAVAWMAERLDNHPALIHLGWPGLSLWRDLVARSFDRPGPGLDPGSIRRITIRHAPPGPSVACLLLGGWLTARLGWTPLGGGGRGTFSMLGPGGRRLIEFRPADAAGGRAGEPVRLTFGGGRGNRLFLARPQDYRPLCLDGRPLAEGRGGRMDLAEALCRALESTAADRVFGEAVRQAAGMAEAARGPA